LLLAGVIVAAAVGVVALGGGPSAEAPESASSVTGATLSVGDAAPPVALASTSGELVELEAFRGKRDVLLYFYEHAG